MSRDHWNHISLPIEFLSVASSGQLERPCRLTDHLTFIPLRPTLRMKSIGLVIFQIISASWFLPTFRHRWLEQNALSSFRMHRTVVAHFG